MFKPVKKPQVPALLTSLIFWGSFTWGLPVNDADAATPTDGPNGASPAEEAAAAAPEEGEPDLAFKDLWGGVRISDAYDYAKCPYCWKKNELRAVTCVRCGYEFPQPSAAFAYPPWVFVPGKGYYREGTLLEPAKIRRPLLITGLALIGGGAVLAAFSGSITTDGYPLGILIFGIPGLCTAGAGAVLVIVATHKKPAVYALGTYGVYGGAAYALKPRYSEDMAFKVEVTALGH